MDIINKTEEPSDYHFGCSQEPDCPTGKRQGAEHKTGMSNGTRHKGKKNKTDLKSQPHNHNLPGAEKIRTRVVTW